MKFLHDVAVNTAANLISAAILYLIAAAANLIPVNNFGVGSAVSILTTAAIAALVALVVYASDFRRRASILLFSAGSGTAGILVLSWNLYYSITRYNELGFVEIAAAFILCSVPPLLLISGTIQARDLKTRAHAMRSSDLQS